MASPTIEQRDQGAALPITTAFAPPAECTQGHLTMLGRQLDFVWQNEPVPVPGTTVRSCFPEQFISSYLASMAGTTLPAFSPLACPQNYYTVSSQDVGTDVPYVVCCPTNYLFALPPATNNKRPWEGGTCYSPISSTTVSGYNNNAFTGLVLFTTTASGQAYAHPIDGFVYNGQHVVTNNPAPATSAAAALQPSSSAAPAASKLSSSAAPGGTLATSGSVAASQNSNTLVSSSSIQGSGAATSTISSSLTPISTSGSVTFFSTISASVITVYAPTSNGLSSVPTQPASARDSAQLTTGAIAGMVVGIILGLVLLAALGVFFYVRRRRRPRGTPSELDVSSKKPSLSDHPSRIYGPDEKKFLYQKTDTVATYHELSSAQEVAHEMAYGNGDKVIERPVGELEAPDLDSLPISTFSPTKT